jgi:5'-nucleotidase
MKKPLRIPRLLLTNDDGFDAPGLKILAEAAAEFTDEIWIIAPEHDQSGVGQGITISEPLRCTPRGERRWAVSGKPADCVAMGLYHFMADAKPSLILSGVNAGGNAGDEVNLSGTIGAAFMGLMSGVPSIALSQNFTDRTAIKWDTARAIAPKMLHHFLTHGWRKETCLSINIPDLPPEKITGFAWARQGQGNLSSILVDRREDHRAGYYYWLKLMQNDVAVDGTDLGVLHRGKVSVTALGLNRSVDVREEPVIFGETVDEEENVGE